jgi:plastocyanin
MNQNPFRMFQIVKVTVLSVAFLSAAFVAGATTHVVQFGGAFGSNYSPKSLNVAVGDTVKWMGAFGSHPLSSTSVPSGAASFHAGSGSVFVYAVLVSGTYLYWCDLHHASGMTGSFVAAETGVEEKQSSVMPGGFRLEQNFPNPFNSSTVIRFSLPSSQKALLKVYSSFGEDIATLVDSVMPAGESAVRFDGGRLASGVYFYRLITDRYQVARRLVVLK